MCVRVRMFSTFHLNPSLEESVSDFALRMKNSHGFCRSSSPNMSFCSYLSLLGRVTSSRCTVCLLRDSVCVYVLYVCVVDLSDGIRDITDRAIIFPVCSLGKRSALVQHPH